jgi:hypothetical protein
MLGPNPAAVDGAAKPVSSGASLRRSFRSFALEGILRQLSPEKKPLTAEGNDERFYDEQEYDRLRKQYNH